MELRLPNSSLVQVGGKQERFFWRVPIPRNDRHCTQDPVNPGKVLAKFNSMC